MLIFFQTLMERGCRHGLPNCEYLQRRHLQDIYDRVSREFKAALDDNLKQALKRRLYRADLDSNSERSDNLQREVADKKQEESNHVNQKRIHYGMPSKSVYKN